MLRGLHDVHFSPSPTRDALDLLRGREAYGTRDTAHSQKAEQLQAAENWRQRLIAAGVMPSLLPPVSSDMGPEDFTALMKHYAQHDPKGLAGATAPAQAAHPAPNVQSDLQGPSALSFAPPKTPASLPPITSFMGARSTPTGLQAPAMRPDGSQMSNPDGSARFVGTLPNIVPPTVQSRVIDPGITAPNYRGESMAQTTHGPSIVVDPRADMMKNWLGAGDSMLPKNATGGVLIDPRYRTPGASPVGYSTTGPAASVALSGTPPPRPVAPLATAAPSAGPTSPQPMRGMGDVKLADAPKPLPPPTVAPSTATDLTPRVAPARPSPAIGVAASDFYAPSPAAKDEEIAARQGQVARTPAAPKPPAEEDDEYTRRLQATRANRGGLPAGGFF